MGVRAILGLVALAGTTVACSLTLDFLQCRDTADCDNADGATLICRDNECIAPPDPTTVPCTTAAECVEAVGDDQICLTSEGHCAALTSAACPSLVVPNEVPVQDLVWLGAIQATSSPYTSIGEPLQNALQLAVADFNSVAKIGGKSVGVILCDSEGSPDVARAAADHLIAAGVQAIVGPTFSEEVIEVASSTVDAGVFLMSPTASYKGITELADQGLVWRNISSDVHQAAALVDRISLLDPDPTKVVLLVKDDLYGNGILEDITDPLLVRLPVGGLVTLKYSDPASFSSNEDLLSQYGSRIATALMANPDTIVVVGTNEARELILFYLDNWTDLEPRPKLPRFIVTHGGVPEMRGIVNAVAESFRVGLMANIEGVAPIIQDEENFAAFNVRYKIRFNDQEALTISSLSYDATLVSLSAMAAAGDGATGVDIAAQIARLVDPTGTPISFGGAGVKFITDATQLLANGSALDLQGVSGALDFNLATGEVRTNLVNWGLVPRSTNSIDPVLTPLQRYVLDAPPASGGDWVPFE
ncbi:MAG: ABC transporter substrate-binding protein [Nannocystaceae bacterium]|nr:ABC transporter substrate-binding protein [Nannocystaceae bacterium]